MPTELDISIVGLVQSILVARVGVQHRSKLEEGDTLRHILPLQVANKMYYLLLNCTVGKFKLLCKPLLA